SCRHYYDTVLLGEHAAGERAMTRLDLLERVTRFKNLFFKSSWSDYASAKPGSFRLVPPQSRRAGVEADYGKMQDFFMVPPPTFEDLWDRLRAVEARINAVGKIAVSGSARNSKVTVSNEPRLAAVRSEAEAHDATAGVPLEIVQKLTGHRTTAIALKHYFQPG
ncbi:MAG TPA: hypothetical protein VK477_14535, partial [Acidobacteriota bacterium]|nr:hypothetical protein [Acidobacteriota bacterium]